MKKSIFLVFYACLLLLFLFTGILIGRNSQTGYVRLSPALSEPPVSQADPQSFGKIDLNTATAADLADLPGIGNVIADRIILYRTENGGFDAVHELLEVEGIGQKKYEQIADYVYAGG